MVSNAAFVTERLLIASYTFLAYVGEASVYSALRVCGFGLARICTQVCVSPLSIGKMELKLVYNSETFKTGQRVTPRAPRSQGFWIAGVQENGR